MDLPLWDTLDEQGYKMFSYGSHYDYSGYELVANQCSYYTEDGGYCDFSFGYRPDTIEEDALNEKSCVEVLRILINKADEDILKLEEDILMLQCQLAWDDENWSKPCSVALQEWIDHLDISIQGLKKKITKDVCDFGFKLEDPGNVPLLIHALVKPLLENYFLVKSKQKENSTIQMSAQPAAGLGEKKTVSTTSRLTNTAEANKCINLRKTNERQSLSMEPKERKIYPIEPEESPISMVKDLSASTSIKKSGSRGRGGRRNTGMEITSKGKVIQRKFGHESKVANSDLESQEMETDLIKVYRRANDKSSASRKPLVNKRKKTNFHERTDALEIQATETKDTDSETLLELFNRERSYAGLPKKKIHHKIQVQHIQEMETIVISQENIDNSLMPESQGPKSTCELAPENAQKSRIAEKMDLISSSKDTIKGQQKVRVPKKTSNKGKKEPRQESKREDASENAKELAANRE